MLELRSSNGMNGILEINLLVNNFISFQNKVLRKQFSQFSIIKRSKYTNLFGMDFLQNFKLYV